MVLMCYNYNRTRKPVEVAKWVNGCQILLNKDAVVFLNCMGICQLNFNE